ncbi:hypothetical protein [Parerythrobacter lacustris]|uniref:Uncharacterized protein n=1 Tax=Parerythrobacter lacustris TaxID=2969984 RepID=A0ABT1XWU1_9SPHN|nr:hypothetical protein [Parerythrobacter lacustris]MCR2835155.1 hypothetical protein [Parerythrobacter lacustris]
MTEVSGKGSGGTMTSLPIGPSFDRSVAVTGAVRFGAPTGVEVPAELELAVRWLGAATLREEGVIVREVAVVAAVELGSGSAVAVSVGTDWTVGDGTYRGSAADVGVGTGIGSTGSTIGGCSAVGAAVTETS